MNISTPTTLDQLDERLTTPSEAVKRAVEASPGTFAVLGAGGKMGFHLCRMLQRALQPLGRASQLVAVSRFSSPESLVPFEREHIATVAADLSDESHFGKLPPADHVFFLAGVKFGTADNPQLLEQMNAVMPRRVARHYADSRIVALSTGCVYSFATPDSGGSKEDDPTDPPGAYAQSCLKREQAFVDASRQRGTRSALVRLNYSIDLRYGVLVDIAKKVFAAEPIDLTTGYVNVIWQGDAITQIIQCLPHAQSPPWVINVTGPGTHRVRDLAEKFGQAFGKTPIFEGSEAPSCWLNNSAKATSLFGRPQVEIDTMIAWIADWLKSGGSTLDKPTHFQVRDGNY